MPILVNSVLRSPFLFTVSRLDHSRPDQTGLDHWLAMEEELRGSMTHTHTHAHTHTQTKAHTHTHECTPDPDPMLSERMVSLLSSVLSDTI
jgi:ABC-type nickel/cobalt efflux system permease component RcnA